MWFCGQIEIQTQPMQQDATGPENTLPLAAKSEERIRAVAPRPAAMNPDLPGHLPGLVSSARGRGLRRIYRAQLTSLAPGSVPGRAGAAAVSSPSPGPEADPKATKRVRQPVCLELSADWKRCGIWSSRGLCPSQHFAGSYSRCYPLLWELSSEAAP